AARPERVLLVPAHFVGELTDVLVDLVRIVAAHHLGEVARWGLFEEARQLSVNVRLHMGLIQARRGRRRGQRAGGGLASMRKSTPPPLALRVLRCTARAERTLFFLPSPSGSRTGDIRSKRARRRCLLSPKSKVTRVSWVP